MPEDPEARRAGAALGRRSTVASLAIIACVVGAAAAIFAYVAGWLTPGRLTAETFMADFQAIGGPHPGFRRNHAKGVCATGTFESSGAAAALSRAVVFKPGRTPVVARFALAGPAPFQPDKPKQVRSLALRLLPAGAEEWRTAMIDIPVFAVRDARGFADSLVASVPGPDGKPDPAKMKAFMAAHPEAAAAGKIIDGRAISSGFADDTFNSLNAFKFVAADGTSTPVRWSVTPVQAFVAASPDAPAGKPNYLFDDLVKAIAAHPLQWHLRVVVGQAGDPTDDATLPWPPDRRVVDAGVLTIDKVHSEDDGGLCTNVVYDPLMVPDGIEGSDDPILAARSSAYARSFTLRAGETKPASDVTQNAVSTLEKGATP